LSVGAFENQPSYTKIIASPPSPYPVLPWPSHDDSPDVAKPFEAAFDPNPIILEPSETRSVMIPFFLRGVIVDELEEKSFRPISE
jgi:hypothetical protein